ncbi:MAG TPA: NAD(P)-dependent alcohol dehydrogenase [Chloroflexota bacterium]|nr:NAD(P)-dependent alcohol dehydrogenase [Chloroflexota bacterium]
MATSVEAVVLRKVRDVALEERSCSDPGPDEVVVAPSVVGICGSDLHLYQDGHIGDSVVEAPLVLGHEAAGRIVAVGERVSTLNVGDRVIVEPGLACGQCRLCRRGRYNLCPNVRFLGIPPSDGLMATRATVPARWTYRLPDHLSDAEGAMIEPFAVGLQAAHEANVQPGDVVAILGAGPIGLMVLQAAKVRGAGAIVSIDLSDRALEAAKQLGATAVVNPRRDDPKQVLQDLTGEGADIVVEAVGASATIRQTLDLARRGGIVTLVGISSEPTVPLNVNHIVRRGIHVRSSFRYANQHPVALALVASGKVDLRAPITHRFPLARVADAFAYIEQNKNEVVKGIVELA